MVQEAGGGGGVSKKTKVFKKVDQHDSPISEETPDIEKVLNLPR